MYQFLRYIPCQFECLITAGVSVIVLMSVSGLCIGQLMFVGNLGKPNDKLALQVLTLSGVARVFNTKRQLLQTLGDFPRAWSLLLEFIENSALSKNNEVLHLDVRTALKIVTNFLIC